MCKDLNKVRKYKRKWTVVEISRFKRVKDLPDGIILWQGYNILGVKGWDLKRKYYRCWCKKVGCNWTDYELITNET